jgi:hypothetical protein
MNILNENIDFMHSTNIKLLSQIKRNLINNYDSSKFIISVTGDHCHYSLQAPNFGFRPLNNKYLILTSGIERKPMLA